jgi:hypothetical protein
MSATLTHKNLPDLVMAWLVHWACDNASSTARAWFYKAAGSSYSHVRRTITRPSYTVYRINGGVAMKICSVPSFFLTVFIRKTHHFLFRAFSCFFMLFIKKVQKVRKSQVLYLPECFSSEQKKYHAIKSTLVHKSTCISIKYSQKMTSK